jgi:hypothetical protein
VAAFARLQGLGARTPGDYEEAFAVCRDARRPFECFSLVRHMAKDGLPRPARLYEETAQLAAEVGNWVTVLDAYLVFERKEQVRIPLLRWKGAWYWCCIVVVHGGGMACRWICHNPRQSNRQSNHPTPTPTPR